MVALVLVLGIPAWSPPAQSTTQTELPSDLADQGDAIRQELVRVAEAGNLSAMRAAAEPVLAQADPVVAHATDLQAREGERLGLFLDELSRSLEAGNETDARSLARAAVNLLEGSILPTFEAWERNRTAVLPGPLHRDGGALILTIVLVNPPPGGLGAFDVRVQLGQGWQPTQASVEVGQGESHVDTANGTARLASFDAKALVGFGSGAPEGQVLGTVRVTAEDGALPKGLPVELDIVELASSQGDPVLALGIGGTLDVESATSQGTLLSKRMIALGAVAVLSVGAIVWVRKGLKV